MYGNDATQEFSMKPRMFVVFTCRLYNVHGCPNHTNWSTEPQFQILKARKTMLFKLHPLKNRKQSPNQKSFHFIILFNWRKFIFFNHIIQVNTVYLINFFDNVFEIGIRLLNQSFFQLLLKCPSGLKTLVQHVKPQNEQLAVISSVC